MRFITFIKFLVIQCVLWPLSLTAQAQDRAYIQRDVVTVAGIKSASQVHLLPVEHRQTSRTYLDGFGRQVQTIALKANPSLQDIVSAAQYDKHGRIEKTFLPYSISSTSGQYRQSFSTEALAFYATANQKVAVDVKPFQVSLYDDNPLGEINKSGSFGEGYQPQQKAKSYNTRGNQASEIVFRWGTDGLPKSNYAPESLLVSEFIREDNQRVISYQNSSGLTVLEKVYLNEAINGSTEPWLETYYVYDDLGRLIYVIPPDAVIKMRISGNRNLTVAGIKDDVFSIKYNGKGQETERSEPGKGTIYKIYDPLDRLVLVQDETLRAQNKWQYIKYSQRNVPISQGIYTDNVRITSASMQTYVSQLSYTSARGERRNTASATGYYTNTVFPTTNLEPLAYVYHNNYDLDGNGSPDLTYQSQGIEDEKPARERSYGKVTMVRQRSVGEGLANVWKLTGYFYDVDGQIVQTRSNNHLNTTVEDSETVVRDFAGKTKSKKTVKKIKVGTTTKTTTVDDKYSFDHSGRLTAIDQRYDNGTFIRIASYEYNKIGQLVDKKLHSTNGGSTHLQSVDYRYTINGQLRSINHPSLGVVAGVNDDANDLFGMEMIYEGTSALGNTPYFSGLLSAVTWRSKTQTVPNPKERSYSFSYDKADRLKGSVYKDRNVGGTWANTGAFNEDNILFDANGNLLTLRRSAQLSGTMTQIDQLQYTYTSGKLTNVSDGATSSHTGHGFRNLTGSTAQYSYDAGGNLITDPKKGISLTYNSLGLTDKITVTGQTGRYITYTYGAGGDILRVKQYNNGTVQQTLDYVDGFVYLNNTLSYFGMAEGRVRNTGSVLKPEYMLTDYQGNVRVSFEEQNGAAVVRQENSFYAFGLIMPGNTHPSGANRQLFNGGSEWQNDYGNLPDLYRTAYRMYDAALGRFLSPDPLALASASHNTYHYAASNPVMFNDPLGLKSAGPISGPYAEFWNQAFSYTSGYGASWSSHDGWTPFSSEQEAFYTGASLISWGRYDGWAGNYEEAAARFNANNYNQVEATAPGGFLTVKGEWYRTASGRPITINGKSANLILYDVSGKGRGVTAKSSDKIGGALEKLNQGFEYVAMSKQRW